MKLIGNKIQIKLDEPKAGKLDLTSKQTAKEKGTVIAIGKGVEDIKVGDVIYFKAWCVDLITDEGKIYYFIDGDSRGLCAKK